MGTPLHPIQLEPQYNNSLINRGSLTFWVDAEAMNNWFHHGYHGRRGRSKLYTDQTICTFLMLKGIFNFSEDGQWIYSADNSQAAIQQLKASATLTDSSTATSADGTTHTVTLTGSNDAPVLQAQSKSVFEGCTALHGHVSLQDNGAWTYTLDNKDAAVQALKGGESFSEHLTVKSADGTTHVLTVTVQGSNDEPVLQALSQSVTEDGS